MDRNLKRRAQRNFGKLLKLLFSAAFFAALALAVQAQLEWLGHRWIGWAIPAALAGMVLVCLLCAARQARRIAGFIPLGDAAAIWWAAMRRRLRSGRPVSAAEANVLILLPIAICIPALFYWGFYHDRAVWSVPTLWPWLAAFGIACLLIYPLAKRASAGRGPRWFLLPGTAAVAIIPIVTVGAIAARQADRDAFAAGPVHRETVLARIEGSCKPGAILRRRYPLCATAATSRGPIRRWPIRVDREAYYLQRDVGTVCIRIPLEWAANGTVRVEGGARRYRAADLIPCPLGLPRIARAF